LAAAAEVAQGGQVLQQPEQMVFRVVAAVKAMALVTAVQAT
jgi:hypothetical protein